MRTRLLALVTTFALVGSAAAQPSKGLQGQPGWAGGTIVKADAATRTITVKQGIDEQTYVLAADAELTAGKKSVPAADLATAVGQRVTIKYVVDGTTRTASKVTLLGASRETATASSTPAPAARPTP
jgi:hypothetical protein